MEFYGSVRLAVFWPVIRRWRAMRRRARELRARDNKYSVKLESE